MLLLYLWTCVLFVNLFTILWNEMCCWWKNMSNETLLFFLPTVLNNFCNQACFTFWWHINESEWRLAATDLGSLSVRTHTNFYALTELNNLKVQTNTKCCNSHSSSWPKSPSSPNTSSSSSSCSSGGYSSYSNSPVSMKLTRESNSRFPAQSIIGEKIRSHNRHCS